MAALLVVALLPIGGCLSPEEAVQEVDSDVAEVLGARQEQLLGARDPLPVEPATDRLAGRTVGQDGLALPDVAQPLGLREILALAARNSRDFQEAKESLWRAVLGFLREKEAFHHRPFGIFSGEVRSAAETESVGAGGEMGITKLLERGGTYAVSVGLDFLRFFTDPTSTDLGSFLNLSISLPLLRNAELNIARENLTQADRDVLYALRDFERFKQTYGVQVVSAYLRVLSQQRRLSNEEANLSRLRYTRERNVALAAEGRLQKVQADQARQQELRGENRLISARQNLERSLDNLKTLLGLPVDLKVQVALEDLDALKDLVAEVFDVPAERCLRAALRGRLDFRNSVDGVTDAQRRLELAESQLQPSLDLNFAATPISKNLKPLRYNFNDGTYSAGADLDLGLDRHLEGISLRGALIDRQRALRDQEAAAEQVKLDVRNALRQLERTREAYQIAQRAVELATERVAMTTEILELGRGTVRDFLESQDALVTSQNDLVDALVEYRIAYLELFRDTGALVVTPGGLDHETSRAVLAVD